MANLSDILVQSALQPNEARLTDAGQNFSAGANLAIQSQNLQLQRQQMQLKMQEFQQAKIEKFAGFIQAGQALKGTAQKNYYNNVAPAYRNSLGLQDMFPDDALKFNTSSPEMLAAIGALNSRVKQGTITQEQAINIFKDPQQMAQLAGVTPSILNSKPLDQETLDEFAKAETTATTNAAQMAKAKYEVQSAGGKEVSQKTGAAYTAFTAEGGASALARKINDLNSAIADLEGGRVQTGNLAGKATNLAPGSLQSTLNPKVKALSDKVLNAVSINEVLGQGTRPTQSEIMPIYQRTFDPAQPNSVNIEKLKDLRNSLIDNANSAMQSYRSQGFMTGVPGNLQKAIQDSGRGTVAPPSPAASDNSGQTAPPPPSLNLHQLDDPNVAKAMTQKIQSNPANAPAIAAKFGITVNQLYKLLGIQGGQ